MSLLLMGLLQVSQLFAAREVLHHAAARAARARTVGFDHWMVRKSARVAAIPIAGPMVVPTFQNDDQQLQNLLARPTLGEVWDGALTATPSFNQLHIEQARIPEYMGSFNWAGSRHILDYERWDRLAINEVSGTTLPDGTPLRGSTLEMTVSQVVSNWVPFHRAFYAADSVSLRGKSEIENHYPLYIDDQNW